MRLSSLCLGLMLLILTSATGCDTGSADEATNPDIYSGDADAGDALTDGQATADVTHNLDAGPGDRRSADSCEEGDKRCVSGDQTEVCSGGIWTPDVVCVHDHHCSGGECVQGCWCHPNDECGDDGCGGACGGGCEAGETCTSNGSYFSCDPSSE